MVKKKLRSILIAFFMIPVLTSCGTHSQESGKRRELHIYNWNNYIGTNTISNFERQFGVKVVYDNYSSNDELYAKLRTGAGGYDLIVPTDFMVEIMIQQNLIQPIDKDRIPNIHNLSSRFLNLPFDPDNKYSLPYFWGSSGVGINSKWVTRDVENWDILFDKTYEQKITLLDDMRKTIGMALRSLGYSANTTNPDEIRQAKEILIKQKILVKAYSSDTYIDLMASGDIWVCYGYSGDICQARKQNPLIKYHVPKGGTILGVDSMCIPNGAQNVELAHEFINYVLDPQVAAEIANEILYPTPNTNALRYIDKSILDDPAIYPPQEVLDKSELLKSVGEATRLYEMAWTEIKAR